MCSETIFYLNFDDYMCYEDTKSSFTYTRKKQQNMTYDEGRTKNIPLSFRCVAD